MSNHNRPTNAFKKSPQGLDELKSKGQIERSKELNILSHIRSNIYDRNIISKTFDVVETELENGNTKNAIELIKIAKENEIQKMDLKADIGIQKLEVSKEDINIVLNRTKDLADEG